MADDRSCESVGPSGAFSGDGEFGAGFSEEVHGEFAQGCEVFRAVILAVSGAVFVEGHLEDPVQGVFDGPMGTDGCGSVRASGGRRRGNSGWRWRICRPPRGLRRYRRGCKGPALRVRLYAYGSRKSSRYKRLTGGGASRSARGRLRLRCSPARPLGVWRSRLKPRPEAADV